MLLCANKLHPALATQTILVRRVSLDLLTKKKRKNQTFHQLDNGVMSHFLHNTCVKQSCKCTPEVNKTLRE